MAERAVVTGASGFIGTRLVARLAGQGLTVTALDLLAPRERRAGVRYVRADLRLPIDPAVAAGARRLYDLAALHRTPGHPAEDYYETNIAGAVHAAELADRAQIPLVVFTSTGAVYGPGETVRTEESPVAPVSHYGRSKALAEAVHRQAAQQAGRRLVVVRPAAVFGPGERGNFTRLAQALRRGAFAYPGRRDVVKSAGHVDELLQAIDFALTRDERETVFNFAYPAASTTADVVAAFGAVTGHPRHPATLPLPAVMAAARACEAAARLGIKTSFHSERVLKLVQATRIRPAWLTEHGYAFQTDLATGLGAWAAETAGRFD